MPRGGDEKTKNEKTKSRQECAGLSEYLVDSTFFIVLSSMSMPVLSTCPLHTNSGCGKERRILIGPW